MTTDNVRLLKQIAGAIKSGMDAHGLDASLAGSLAKRVLPVVRAELDKANQDDIARIYADLAARQEPLGAEFEAVIEANLDNLYEN